MTKTRSLCWPRYWRASSPAMSPYGSISMCVALMTTALVIVPAGVQALTSLPLLDESSDWDFNDSGDNLDVSITSTVQGWTTAGWTTGVVGPFGRGNGDEATLVRDATTVYYRTSFTVRESIAPLLRQLEISVIADDGAVFWLNGVQIARVRMPETSIDSSTLATTSLSGAAENTFQTLDTVSLAIPLLAGSNVLVVEVHQARPAGSGEDSKFIMRLTGLVRVTDPVPCPNPVEPGSPFTVSKGPILQSVGSNMAVVQWVTLSPFAGAVIYGTTTSELNKIAVSKNCNSGLHEAYMRELEADTKYFYRITSAANTAAQSNGPQGVGVTYSFTTSPPVGHRKARKTRFWALGDAGTGTSVQLDVIRGYGTWMNSHAPSDNMEPDAILMLGDNAYNDGTSQEYSDNFFAPMKDILPYSHLWMIAGNHDVGPGTAGDAVEETGPYFSHFSQPTNGEAGGTPSGAKAYYSYDHGDIHFVVLETTQTDLDVMLEWVKKDLRNAATYSKWAIVMMHHPPYSKGSHNSDTEDKEITLRKRFVPVFDEFGVDLILSGHSHSYERSYLIRGHYGFSETFNINSHSPNSGELGNPEKGSPYVKSHGIKPHEGLVAVVAGSAGKTENGEGFDHPAMVPLSGSMRGLLEPGSVVLEVFGDTLDLFWIDTVGNVRDRMRMVKQGDISASPQPSATTSAIPVWEVQNAATPSSVPSIVPSASNTPSSQPAAPSPSAASSPSPSVSPSATRRVGLGSGCTCSCAALACCSVAEQASIAPCPSSSSSGGGISSIYVVGGVACAALLAVVGTAFFLRRSRKKQDPNVKTASGAKAGTGSSNVQPMPEVSPASTATNPPDCEAGKAGVGVGADAGFTTAIPRKAPPMNLKPLSISRVKDQESASRSPKGSRSPKKDRTPRPARTPKAKSSRKSKSERTGTSTKSPRTPKSPKSPKLPPGSSASKPARPSKISKVLPGTTSSSKSSGSVVSGGSGIPLISAVKPASSPGLKPPPPTLAFGDSSGAVFPLPQPSIEDGRAGAASRASNPSSTGPSGTTASSSSGSGTRGSGGEDSGSRRRSRSRREHKSKKNKKSQSRRSKSRGNGRESPDAKAKSRSARGRTGTTDETSNAGTPPGTPPGSPRTRSPSRLFVQDIDFPPRAPSPLRSTAGQLRVKELLSSLRQPNAVESAGPVGLTFGVTAPNEPSLGFGTSSQAKGLVPKGLNTGAARTAATGPGTAPGTVTSVPRTGPGKGLGLALGAAAAAAARKSASMSASCDDSVPSVTPLFLQQAAPPGKRYLVAAVGADHPDSLPSTPTKEAAGQGLKKRKKRIGKKKGKALKGLVA